MTVYLMHYFYFPYAFYWKEDEKDHLMKNFT